MSEKEKENTGSREVEIDIQRLLGAVWHRFWLVILVAILCALIAFIGTFYLITPKYQSSSMFYVNNNSFSVGDTSFSLTSGDITASKDLVDSYIVILKTRASLNDVIDYAGIDRTYEELYDMISAASVNSTEIFEVVVTSPDPAEAEKIANAITEILPKRIASIIEGTSAEIVDAAVIASKPSSPSYTGNTLIGFILGFVLMIAIVALQEIFDITIRTEEDVSQVCELPILAAVPDMGAPSKGGYYSYNTSRKKKKSKSKSAAAAKDAVLIGSGVSFAASEAYKLLRTKLQFSFADEKDCYVIGVSSALAGEGKSLTSINLAYSLAQLDKRVLLIDCDMRRPSLSTKLPIQKVPGLSNYLTRQVHREEVIQTYVGKAGEAPFHVIASGRNPPNPIELLSSARMEAVINQLKASYDYIVLDLPPVEEVSDAMAVAKLTDGVLLVSRLNYCNRVALGSTVRQFEFVNSRILGIVMNCATDAAGSGKYKYGRYYRYGRYSYRSYRKYYYHSYQGTHALADDASKKPVTKTNEDSNNGRS